MKRRHALLWKVLSTGLSVAGAMLARRVAVKVWSIGTGEQPPTRF